MELSLVLEYSWVILVLIVLEGLLAADNALVLAVMVKHLPEEKRKKALFYGLAGAFLFRFASLFAISFLIDIWQLQAIGALYLMFIAVNHIVRKVWLRGHEEVAAATEKPVKKAGFWTTVLKVEIADIAFAVDSILAAVAIAVSLPKTNLPTIGGMDGGHFIVVFIGGFMGVVIMRFAANLFVTLLQKKPGLEIAAFLIVGWVGVKLTVFTLSHPTLAILPEGFAASSAWKITFYVVLIGIAVAGWFLSKEVEHVEKQEKNDVTSA
ncbi:TerC family protein [Halalkalibacterium halodurans]|jgi:YkoY family integral membrane protein|uniref:BH2553 protein n=2 Tax=Halalkalibacterium halodurans TaxID=86665 RepID=Q9K9U2_HALH5|nr:TerC family protein [Halalkalibacterium halodurans]MDY7223091.1 TerC family protein [Halalkalibacterium halodurans]MDY7242312.1 TerC family protein [Halalkalibacterium halodurans]MED3646141.1 TerC family protein [Halalkalibacterium halodurans]MED4079699.1 TerC family protein [Halalkalibacterium halodurans]MED4086359.1 TerC family protein [Halalkalibacterium halodurans]